MSQFINEQGITQIQFDKNIIMYCPMGEGHYLAKIKVEFAPNDIIMDYLDIDKFFKKLEGQKLIIENTVNEVFMELLKYEPIRLKVTVTAESNVHLPVTVIKEKYLI